MSRETVGLTKEENRRALVLATAGLGGRTNEQIAQALGLSIRQRHIDGALLQARLEAAKPVLMIRFSLKHEVSDLRVHKIENSVSVHNGIETS